MATIIHTEPLQIGGEVILLDIPEGYEGPAKVVRTDGTDEVLAAFPSVKEARAAAYFAVMLGLGGYGSNVVQPANPEDITHQRWEDWAF